MCFTWLNDIAIVLYRDFRNNYFVKNCHGAAASFLRVNKMIKLLSAKAFIQQCYVSLAALLARSRRSWWRRRRQWEHGSFRTRDLRIRLTTEAAARVMWRQWQSGPLVVVSRQCETPRGSFVFCCSRWLSVFQPAHETDEFRPGASRSVRKRIHCTRCLWIHSACEQNKMC